MTCPNLLSMQDPIGISSAAACFLLIYHAMARSTCSQRDLYVGLLLLPMVCWEEAVGVTTLDCIQGIMMLQPLSCTAWGITGGLLQEEQPGKPAGLFFHSSMLCRSGRTVAAILMSWRHHVSGMLLLGFIGSRTSALHCKDQDVMTTINTNII